MTSTPTLVMPDFNNIFIIETDASGDGIGAMLQQQGKPIAFMSWALGVAKNHGQLMQKRCLQSWKPYEHGGHIC